jgi:hypothetical protein
MTEQEDEIRLKDLLDIYSKEEYKEIIEILNRDQKRYHQEQLILSGVSQQNELLFCAGCGHKKDLNRYTDINSGRTCKNKLCKQNNCG